MTTATTTEFRQPPPTQVTASQTPLRRAAAGFWLRLLFWQAKHALWISRVLKPLAMKWSFEHSKIIRSHTAANARSIFGPAVSHERVEVYTRGVIENFFEFVCDVGRSLRLTREQLVAKIESVEGKDNYYAARAAGKGAIVATAHMGSFEAGAAGLIDLEKKLHVVFKRDQTQFEEVRAALRQKLGVIEAPVDDGWTVWLRLREALQRDEVVMLQADRVMPGQKGLRLPFLHGHLLIPTAPVKLALASGAPIVPIFALRTPQGRIRIHIEPAIWAEQSEVSPHPALVQLAGVLEKYVREYPEQWLLFHSAFFHVEEDDA